jgi:hypothetical protein
MNVYENMKHEELVEIWNRFVFWRKIVMSKLPEQKRLFWVMDDGVFFMMIYPEDY